MTLACIACGISFFGPFWLNNVDKAKDAATGYLTRTDSSGLVTDLVSIQPFRGLWAQCGKSCTWFWENQYELQQEKFTPLKWHLATQVLYFIACTIMLGSEIFARVQMCCKKEYSVVYIILAILLFASVILQTAALATFGGGASREADYQAISDPAKIGEYLRAEISGTPIVSGVYLGWCYWMALVGDLLTLLAAVFFLFASFCSDGCPSCSRGRGGCCGGR
jgi:hypothetical protein